MQPRPASAGHWSDPVYHYNGSNTSTSTDSTGTYTDTFAWYDADYPDEEMFSPRTSAYQGYSGSVDASGTITATFTWIHIDPNNPQNDPHPLKVYLQQTSGVEWLLGWYDNPALSTGTGRADDGFGDPEVVDTSLGEYNYGKISQGIHLIQMDGADTITVTWSISGHCEVQSNAQDQDAILGYLGIPY